MKDSIQLSCYQKLIVEATECDPKDAAEIEDIMRDVIFHSTLDWQTKRQFDKGARKAKKLLDYMRSPEGIAEIERAEREMLRKYYEQYKSNKGTQRSPFGIGS